MKRLFSPWRSEYIKTFSDKKKGKGCLFCRIAKEKKDDKNLIAWRGEHCFVVMNKYPYNNGHIMVVPYKHTSRLSKLNEKEYKEILEITSKCITALEKLSKPQGFNFGANFGRVAGAGIDKHIHFHLVPRWNGDTNFMPVLGNVKIVSEDLRDCWLKLKSALKTS